MRPDANGRLTISRKTAFGVLRTNKRLFVIEVDITHCMGGAPLCLRHSALRHFSVLRVWIYRHEGDMYTVANYNGNEYLLKLYVEEALDREGAQGVQSRIYA